MKQEARDFSHVRFTLTSLVYKELEENEVPISKEMLLEYYKDMGWSEMEIE